MEFKDRVANKPNRVKLTYEDSGASSYATVELADEPIENGTPLNKATFDAMQKELLGFNPHNLLDNSDFTNPVNQRGNTSITCTESYQPFIDRWYVQSVFDHPTTLSVTDEGIDTDVGNVIMWQQRFAPNTFDSANKVYTAVVYQADGGIMVYTNNIVAHNGTYDSVTIPQEFGATAAVALYEGIYTADNVPAYKPKGYAAELAECQRYYKRISWGVMSGYITNAGKNFVTMMPGVPMVKAPTGQVSGSGYYMRTAAGIHDTTGSASPYGIDVATGINGTKITLKWKEAFGDVDTINNRPAILEMRDADNLGSEIVISAEY